MRDFAKFMHWCKTVRPNKCKWIYSEIILDVVVFIGIVGIAGGLMWLSH